MQEFDVFYYHSPITYTLTKLIIDQEKKAFYCEIGGRGIHHPGTIQIEDDGVWDIEKTVQFFEGKIAKWWTPDDVVFVPVIPIGPTGKMLKGELRNLYANHLLNSSKANA